MQECFLKPAQQSETGCAMEMIEQAKEHLKIQGINQWQNGYPDLPCIEKDVKERKGYFLMSGEERIGYLCIDFNGEPAYEKIEGKWKGERAYGVIHRLAISDAARGKGNAGAAFSLAQEMCINRGIYSIRVDTQAGNKKMQHILAKCGFEYCGIIWYEDGERMAFEKLF